MKIYYDSKLAKLILFPGFGTIMLFGIVFTKREKLSDFVIVHEFTHCKQYWTLFVTGLILALITFFIWTSLSEMNWWMLMLLSVPFLLFYVWYLLEAFIRMFINGPSNAYNNISFEKRANEVEDEYDGSPIEEFVNNNYKPFDWL